jgi:molybdenum cofactor guanylyltransferase
VYLREAKPDARQRGLESLKTARPTRDMIKGVGLVAAFVLVGGKSSRMGRDKAFLELAGKSLVDRALELARRTSDQVVIVGDPKKFHPWGTVVADRYAERGPLAGIHAALESSDRELNLIVAVDLPFLTPEFLNYLLSQAKASGATVTVPRADGGFQPLCAVYRKSFQAIAERALGEGRNKIDSLFAEVPLRIIGEEEIVAQGFSPAMFRNLNAPKDWERAKQEFASLG